MPRNATVATVLRLLLVLLTFVSVPVMSGTSAGAENAYLVKDINLGPIGLGPSHLTSMGGTLFFRGSDGDHGLELWRSDGTSQGTTLVRDIYPGDFNSSRPEELTDVSGTLFFSAYEPDSGAALYKSDGTNSGTTKVRSIVPYSNFRPERLTAVSDTLFFTHRASPDD